MKVVLYSSSNPIMSEGGVQLILPSQKFHFIHQTFIHIHMAQ